MSEVHEKQEVEIEESATLGEDIRDARLDAQKAKKAYEKASKRDGGNSIHL